MREIKPVAPPVFNSKIDTWLGALLLAVPAGALVSAGIALAAGSLEGALGALITLAVILVIYKVLAWPITYTLKPEHLEIRFGVCRSKVAYETVQGIVPTRNPISSPALSLDRLHIQTGSFLGPNISPADKAGFLQAFAEQAPHLKVEGDKLVKA
jgi:hypothetical protein